MSYNFTTIDGLFRPNYKVYKPSEVQIKEPNNIEPLIVPYKPQNVQRVKSFITEPLVQEYMIGDSEIPEYEKEIPQPHFTDQQKQKNYEHFKAELDKFIIENPQYKSIKKPLQYLAELESDYRMSIPNQAGSSALGWFQFIDDTRKQFNNQSREQFAQDPQAQLLAAAQYYTKLQNEIAKRGGDPTNFVTMYGAWWRPESAYNYLTNPHHNFATKYNENFQQILQRARNLLNTYGESYS